MNALKWMSWYEYLRTHNIFVLLQTSPHNQSESEEEHPQNALFLSYREQIGALLLHLVQEKGLPPNHPLISAFECQLFMTTAHAELQKVFEQMMVMTDVRALVRACFVGSDLRYSHLNRNAPVATSIDLHYEERDNKDENGWVVQDNGYEDKR